MDLPAFVESSAMALPLYTKVGFRPVETIELPLEKYGGTGSTVLTAMVRKARSSGEH